MNKHETDIYNSKYKLIGQQYYQRGYVDGYKRRNQIDINIKRNSKYFQKIISIIMIFILLILIMIYVYPHKLDYSNFKDNCLLNLTSTYNGNNCF